MNRYSTTGADIIERQAVEINKLDDRCKLLADTVESLQTRLSSVGLTADELQDIHGLIQGQISLISSLQNQDDCLKIHSAVTPLAILASLVSSL